MRFPKKLLNSEELPVHYARISLHVFMSWAHSTLRGEEVLKAGLNRAHWNPNFNSRISDQDRKEREEGFLPYTSTKTPLMKHM